MWEYICPKCRKTVEKNSHECPHCGERFPLALKVPPSFLKNPKKLEEYVHKHVFPRVDKLTRAYLTQFFTVLFSDGFDDGTFDAWTGHSGGSIVESPVHHGSYSMKRDADGDRAYKYLPSSYSKVYGRLYWQLDALPTTDTLTTIWRFYNGASVFFLLDYWNDGGTYKWRLRAEEISTSDTYTQTISVNTWYCLEVLYDADNDLHKLWVDGVERISFSAVVAAAMERCSVGVNGGAWWTHNEYADCVVVADAYIGPEEEVTLKTATDSFSLSESVLRNKTLILPDSLGLADSLYGNKVLLLGDSASLSELVTVIIGEVMKYVTDSVNIVDLIYALKILKTPDSLTLVDAVSTPSRVLKALEAIGATDNAVVNKVLQITEAVGLAEIVEVGVGGVKKTRVFLILGDLAVQLTGN
jgi:DNA-directed RNA polymerase subunit RPC12/RpoP